MYDTFFCARFTHYPLCGRLTNMETLILATKLYKPAPQTTAINRPALLAKLDRSLAGKLTLLAAPAGFGKSTLVSQWVHGVGRPVAWLTLDGHDNDPTRFLSYLIATFRQIEPTCGVQTLALLRSPGPTPVETLLTTLVNEVALMSQPFLLVLDDYHLIEAEAVHGMVNFWLGYLPPQLHLVIISRSEPPLALARLRASGALVEMRAADLRFSPAEVTEFFATTIGVRLTPAEVTALDARTEGWVAGLRLAAVVLQNITPTADPARFATFLAGFGGDDRHLFDYLTAEVFARLTAEQQAFLVQTAVLERLCGALCDAVTNNPGSQLLLKELARANLFLLPLDNQRHWYRYHPLFADFLRHRLQRLPSDHLTALHRRAADWYATHGFAEVAIDHALAAHDELYAAQLIEGNTIRLARSNEIGQLARWLRQLPPALSQKRPLLAFAQAGVALLTSQFLQAKQWIEVAEQALAALPATVALPLPTEMVQGCLDAVRCTVMVNLREPVEEIITIARRALVNLPEDEPFLRGAVALNLGDAYARQPEATLAAAAFAEAVALTQEAGNLTVHLAALGSQGELLAHQGHLQQAAALFQRAIAIGQAWGQATGQSHPASGKAHAFYARVLTTWGQWEQAERQARAAVECCKRWGHARHLVDSYLVLRNALLAQGNGAAAQEALTAARLVATASWQRAQEQGIDPDAARELLELIDQAQPLPSRPATTLVEPLSERECDVLRLMADDLTYEAIGAALFISLNTVRTHTKNIYSKLNVNRRNQAIARGRELGLL